MLSSLTDMFLCGPSAKRNSNFDHGGRTYVALSIAKLLMYTAIKKKPSKPATNIRHKVDRETPLAIYIALKIDGAAEHCEDTLNQLDKLGMSFLCPSKRYLKGKRKILLLKCLRGEV